MNPAPAKFKPSRLLCWGILLLSGILYGSSFSWIKLAVDGDPGSSRASPLGLVFWFAAIAAAILAVELAAFRRFKHLEKRHIGFCIPWAIISVILPNILFFYAATNVQPSVIAIGIALVPILTLAGAVLLRREILTPGRAAGIALGAIGVGLILIPETSLPDQSSVFFVALAFTGAACYAGEHLFIEIKLPQDIAIDHLLFVMFLAAAALLLPVTLATGSFFVPSWPVGTTELAIVGVSGVTLLDYFLITLLIVWAGPVFTSQAAYIVTIAGVVWGIVIFGDVLSIWLWAAIAVLMLGLMLVRPREERP